MANTPNDKDIMQWDATLAIWVTCSLDTAGLVAKSLYDANTILAADADNTPAALTVAEQRIVGRKTGGNIAALTGAEVQAIMNPTASRVLGKKASGDAGELTGAETLAVLNLPGCLQSETQAATSAINCDVDLGTPTAGDLILFNIYSSITADSSMVQAFSEFKQQSGGGVIEFLNGYTSAYSSIQLSVTGAYGVTMFLGKVTTTGTIVMRNILYQTNAVNPVYINRIKVHWLKKA